LERYADTPTPIYLKKKIASEGAKDKANGSEGIIDNVLPEVLSNNEMRA
jgi:hypothetical protein